MNNLELIIADIKKSLDNECLFSALSLSLIVPDICGKLLYPEMKTGERYRLWYNEYIGNYDKSPTKGMPYLSGKVVYKLRCAFLHSGGSEDVETVYDEFNLDEFVFQIESKKTVDIYVDSASIEEDNFKNKTTTYTINIRRFCQLIILSAEVFMKNNKDLFAHVMPIKIFDYDNDCLLHRQMWEEERSRTAKIKKDYKKVTMRLFSDPFEMMKKGIKTIELRLDDEKRQELCVGDFIEFINIQTNEILKTRIIKLHHFKNFEDLYNYFDDKTKLGYKRDEVASHYDMLKYYPQEKINFYGALGIEIELN